MFGGGVGFEGVEEGFARASDRQGFVVEGASVGSWIAGSEGESGEGAAEMGEPCFQHG